MTVEIKELVMRVIVNNKSASQELSAEEEINQEVAPYQNNYLVSTCVEEVLNILARKKER